MIEASRELLAPKQDVWALIAEPYHLPDWWPAYSGVTPDRRGLERDARWRVQRTSAPGLLRRPSSEGTIVITLVDPGLELRWRDVDQALEAGVRLINSGTGRTRATAYVDGAWWRVALEGARPLPRQSLARLHALCQTAATL